MVALRARDEVAATLTRLAEALDTLEFGADTAGLASERDRLTAMISNYLVPRAHDPDQPLVVVVAGPTGSGKSTLVNSLAGLDVSRTGAIRPTTRTPVVLAATDWADRYESIGGATCRVVRGRAPLLESVVLVDTPDLDSTSTDHRATAERLIDNADVVVFVTSALRYADEVPWQVLRRAESRGAPVIPVLNRVTSSASGAIVDFRPRLRSAGLDDRLITISEHHLADGEQRLPAIAVRPLRERLDLLVDEHGESIRGLSHRVLKATITQTRDLADSMTKIADDIDRLETAISSDLSSRAATLDLSGVGDHLHPTAPDPASPRRLRRWMRGVERTDPAQIEGAVGRLIDRIEAVVQSDVRKWLLDAGSTLSAWNVDVAAAIATTRPVTRSHLEGWVEFVSRIVSDEGHGRPWLAQAVLLDGATRPEPTFETSLIFGEDGHVLTDRARRELGARIGLIYEAVARIVVDQVEERHGGLDTDEVRLALGATTMLAAVDA